MTENINWGGVGPGRRRPLPQVRIPWRLLAALAVLLLLLVAGQSSYVIVQANEEGVITRFGKFQGMLPPGLHFKLPMGIDRVATVQTALVHKEEFGFRTRQVGTPSRYAPRSSQDLSDESLMVTGDLNMAQVEWIVQFRIKDAKDFLFRMVDPVDTLRDISESVMREVVGDMTVTEVLTEERESINTGVKAQMQATLDHYGSGIFVTDVILQDVNPPEIVKPAFDDVNTAQQEREKTINEARQAYNKAVPLARGDKLKLIEEAEGFALDRVNRAHGDVARFRALLAEYQKAPAITRTRLYLESMRDLLPKLERRVIIDDSLRGILPVLGLERGGK
jgi:membrane protease subunit HflK